MDEMNAYYAEQVLGNKYTLEKLLEAEPTLKDKILSFFKSASTDYADVPKLAGAAKKYYRTYKKLFDEFSTRNYESNALENAHLGTDFEKNAQKISITGVNSENMQDSGRDYAAQEQAKFAEYNKPISKVDVDLIHDIATKTPEISINKFTRENIEATQKWAYKFNQELGAKSPFFRAWFGEWRAKQKSTFVDVQEMERREGKNPRGSYVNNDTGWTINSSSIGYDETNSHSGKDKKSVIAMQNIDKIIQNAILLDTEISNPGRGKKSIYTAFMHKFYAPISIDGKQYIAKMAVDESYMPGQKDTNKKFYHVRAIEIETAPSVGIGKSHTPIMESTVSKYSIADLYEFVKGYDKDFTPAREISEHLLNEDGTPKVFYHGTRENFTTFELQDKPKFGRALGDGFYFTSSYDKAFKFANGLFSKGQDRGGIIMPVYLQMENPYIIQPDADRRNWIKEYNAGNYDGIIDLKNDTYYVEGKTQIKSAKNNIGTFSKYEGDINYALDIDSDEGKISGATVMSWLNKKPENDGKLDLEATVARGLPYKRGKSDLTVGELRKVIANTTHEKVYSKSDALKAVNKLSGTWGLTVKARDEIADTVWQFLNEAPDIEYRQDMAHDIAEYIVAKVLMDSKTENPDALEAAERLSYLRTGIGKLSFSDEDIAELRHAVDDKGLKRLMWRWGFKFSKKDGDKSYSKSYAMIFAPSF